MSRNAEARRRFNSSTSSLSASSPDNTMKRTISLGEPNVESPSMNIYRPESGAMDNDEKKAAVDTSTSVFSWFSFPSSNRTLTRPDSSDSMECEDSLANLGFELTPLGENALEITSESNYDLDREDSFDIEKDSLLVSPSSTGSERPKRLHRFRESFAPKPLDIEKYAAARVMSKTQERWNAITMVPPALYCLVYMVYTNTWVNSELMAQAREEYTVDPENFSIEPTPGFAGFLNGWFGNENGCFESNFLPAALPPLAVLAIVFSTCVHLPFSFVYHWRYAHKLEGTARINHWSRKMDQSMIHFASALYSFGTSGSMEYFFACSLFNLDCARRHFLPHFRPRSNQVRIAISVLAYSLPILRRGDLDRFITFWLIMAISMWLFAQYPLGPWSHVAFHLVIGCIVPLLLSIAVDLPVSQPQLKLAAQCAVLRQNSI